MCRGVLILGSCGVVEDHWLDQGFAFCRSFKALYDCGLHEYPRTRGVCRELVSNTSTADPRSWVSTRMKQEKAVSKRDRLWDYARYTLLLPASTTTNSSVNALDILNQMHVQTRN